MKVRVCVKERPELYPVSFIPEAAQTSSQREKYITLIWLMSYHME